MEEIKKLLIKKYGKVFHICVTSSDSEYIAEVEYQGEYGLAVKETVRIKV
jgi:hypothetical protein